MFCVRNLQLSVEKVEFFAFLIFLIYDAAAIYYRQKLSICALKVWWTSVYNGVSEFVSLNDPVLSRE